MTLEFARCTLHVFSLCLAFLCIPCSFVHSVPYANHGNAPSSNPQTTTTFFGCRCSPELLRLAAPPIASALGWVSGPRVLGQGGSWVIPLPGGRTNSPSSLSCQESEGRGSDRPQPNEAWCAPKRGDCQTLCLHTQNMRRSILNSSQIRFACRSDHVWKHL